MSTGRDSATMTVGKYASSRGLSTSAVLRAIRERNAPAISRGSAGRGRATLVDSIAFDRWRGRSAVDVDAELEKIAEALYDTLTRTADGDLPAHRTLGIPVRAAAALLAIAYERIAQRLTGRADVDTLPDRIELLRKIVRGRIDR